MNIHVGLWWNRCRMLVAALVGRPSGDLADLQGALLHEVRRASTRTLGGTTCYPTGAFVRLSRSDMPLWRNFRDLVQTELDLELTRVAAEQPNVRYLGCRVTAVTDDDVRPGRPVVQVDWCALTQVTPPPPPAAAGKGVVSQAPGAGLRRGRRVARSTVDARRVDADVRPRLDGRGSTVTAERELTSTVPWPAPTPDASRASSLRGWLVVDEPGGEWSALPGDGDPPVTIGRGAANGIQVPSGDRTVSKVHAVIERVGGGWVIDDLCSCNGTWVNGDRVTSGVRIPRGAVIQVGQTELRLEIRPEPEASP